MSVESIQPKGRLQNRIVKAVSEYRNRSLELEEVYDSVCNMFPMMKDSDVCFLDLFLYNEFGRHHKDLKQEGDVPVGGLKVCLGPNDFYFFTDKPKKVRYNSLTRTHFCEGDVFAEGISYMAVAVKVVNPMYGTDQAVVDLSAMLNVENKINPVATGGKYCVLAKDEYSKIVYIPLMSLAVFRWLSIIEENLKFHINVIANNSDDIAAELECFFIGECEEVLSSVKLLRGRDKFDKGLYSSILLGEVNNVKVDLYLKFRLLTQIMDTMPVTVLVNKLYATKADPIYRRNLDFIQYSGNIFHYSGNLFDDYFRKNNKRLFRNGNSYKVSFWYMGKEMFWLRLHYSDGQFSCEESYRDFIEADGLGRLWKDAEK